jgi:hypothetical protein
MHFPKIIFLRPIIAILALPLFFSYAALAQGHAKFAKTRHDFAEIKEETGLASTVFSFENTGTKPIKVLSVKATCGCTTPIWSRDSVMPGSSGFVKVEYNPLGRPGVFAKEILVETDGSPSHISLTIHGKVTPRPKGPEDFYPFEEGSIRMRTNHLTYGSVYDDDTITQSTVLYNQGTKTITFSKSSSKVPNHLKPQLSKMSLAPGDTLTLSVSYVAGSKKDWGFAFDNIYLSTNDVDRPMKRINISADIAERFSAADKAMAPHLSIAKMEIDMGTITDGDMPKAIFEVQNTGKSELIVRKLSAACSCIEAVSSGPLGPSEQGTITLTFNSRGRIGEFEKDAILITNDPNQAVTTLLIKGKVVRAAGGGGEAGGRDE